MSKDCKVCKTKTKDSKLCPDCFKKFQSSDFSTIDEYISDVEEKKSLKRKKPCLKCGCRIDYKNDVCANDQFASDSFPLCKKCNEIYKQTEFLTVEDYVLCDYSKKMIQCPTCRKGFKIKRSSNMFGDIFMCCGRFHCISKNSVNMNETDEYVSERTEPNESERHIVCPRCGKTKMCDVIGSIECCFHSWISTPYGVLRLDDSTESMFISTSESNEGLELKYPENLHILDGFRYYTCNICSAKHNYNNARNNRNNLSKCCRRMIYK